MSYLLGLISDILGGLIGAFFVLWIIERRRKAAIRMEPGDIKTEDGGIKYATVKVSNEGMPKYLAWAFDRETALQCKVALRFDYENLPPVAGDEIEERWIDGRWDEAHSPEFFKDATGQLRFQHIEYTVDIPSGAEKTISLAIWLKDPNEIYVWNDKALARLNASMDPLEKLDQRKYIVRVRVTTLGRPYSEDFVLHADKGYCHFRLDTRA